MAKFIFFVFAGADVSATVIVFLYRESLAAKLVLVLFWRRLILILFHLSEKRICTKNEAHLWRQRHEVETGEGNSHCTGMTGND